MMKEKVISDFDNKLHSNELFTVNSRVLTKLSSFAHSINNNSDPHTKLKTIFKSDTFIF